jgi:hypothetical protein
VKGSRTEGPRDNAYVVLSGCSLARCILIRISVRLSDMTDDLLLQPNVVIELHLCYT